MEILRKIEHPQISEILVYANKESAAKAAAESIIKAVNQNPEIAITYATGDTMIPVYSELAKAVQTDSVDFSKTTAFHLDEYYPYGPDRKYSFVKFLKELVFDLLKIQTNNRHTLNGLAENPDDEAEKYDNLLRNKIGLTLLGVGPGGHIAFNDPNTSFKSRTHLAELSKDTVYRDKVERGQDTPETALTQGIGTILESQELLMVAYGTKGDYLHSALYEPISEDCPASALRLFQREVSIIIDNEAGIQIELKRERTAV